MTRAQVLLMVMIGSSCGRRTDNPTTSNTPTVEQSPSTDTVRGAVFTTLSKRFTRYNYLDIWLSHNYSLAYWEPKLREHQAEIDRIRK